jgi:hypothetical protein
VAVIALEVGSSLRKKRRRVSKNIYHKGMGRGVKWLSDGFWKDNGLLEEGLVR